MRGTFPTEHKQKFTLFTAQSDKGYTELETNVRINQAHNEEPATVTPTPSVKVTSNFPPARQLPVTDRTKSHRDAIKPSNEHWLAPKNEPRSPLE